MARLEDVRPPDSDGCCGALGARFPACAARTVPEAVGGRDPMPQAGSPSVHPPCPENLLPLIKSQKPFLSVLPRDAAKPTSENR